MKNLLSRLLRRSRKTEVEKEKSIGEILLEGNVNYIYKLSVNPEIWGHFPQHVRGHDILSMVIRSQSGQEFNYSGKANLVFQPTYGGERYERKYEDAALHLRDIVRKVECKEEWVHSICIVIEEHKYFVDPPRWQGKITIEPLEQAVQAVLN